MSSQSASFSSHPESASAVVPFPSRSITYPSRREVLASAACKGLIGLSLIGLICAFVLPDSISKHEPEPLASAEFSDDLSDLGTSAASVTPRAARGPKIIPASAVDPETTRRGESKSKQSAARSSAELEAEIEVELDE
jgi:hypothetical protein